MSDHAFWQFSVKLWENADLRNTMLSLQNDFGQDVNLWLFACWIAIETEFDFASYKSEASNIITSSQEKVVKPLRTVRQSLAKNAQNQALRAALLTAELEAEKLEQNTLFSLLENERIESPKKHSLSDRLMANLQLLSISSGCKIPKKLAMNLVQTLLTELSLKEVEQMMRSWNEQ